MSAKTKNLQTQGKLARKASRVLARLSADRKNIALNHIATSILDRQNDILGANQLDINIGKSNGLSDELMDRLFLSVGRLQAISDGVNAISAMPDPIGEMYDMETRPNGMIVGKKRVPLGVIGAIYESRPNVTVDIAALCLKSGNASLLRGGSEAINTNRVLASLIRDALEESGVPKDGVQFVDDPQRNLVDSILRMDAYIDLLVPRGGADFIRFVSQNATMPVLAGGVGVCHTYIDKAADVDMAVRISSNAKIKRPTVCNALDTLLVHSKVASQFLPVLVPTWAAAGVEMRCDMRSLSILELTGYPRITAAHSDDFGKEFLSLIAAIKIVDSLDEAVKHIETYGSGHSEAIVTQEYSTAMSFLSQIDAAAVYVNASTYFTDGAQFGLGAEMGISTQKFHARGPIGLKEATSYKWIIFGDGHIRE
ncbi:glutamate-5-semialdehyde dehydrogenase [SAR202 cluster bacterium AD-804-J14_MRT_500m]|nr:glutamate-5-semialdehyde dehydrogenase [SAR202 cluster bacterium AD-804-J14_MRT_500m]